MDSGVLKRSENRDKGGFLGFKGQLAGKAKLFETNFFFPIFLPKVVKFSAINGESGQKSLYMRRKKKQQNLDSGVLKRSENRDKGGFLGFKGQLAGKAKLFETNLASNWRKMAKLGERVGLSGVDRLVNTLVVPSLSKKFIKNSQQNLSI